MRRFARLFACLTLPLAALAAASSASRAEQPVSPVDFHRQIRPILAANCFACHGPDEAERKAQLRLDTKAGALADRGGSAAVVPGNAAESQLLARITSADPDEVMPPADSPKKLSREEIELLRRWIAEGSNWPEHWAYAKPVRPLVPSGRGAQPALSPIDDFIRAKLSPLGLSPSPEADRVTLARRLSFDLTGLPPATIDVERFVVDDSPQAYENLVDRLLASPHYGERMAMYWLDAVRFADTNGYHGDNHRDIALYRDYVIDAFNSNKPFDRFTVEQLAGDLLPDATRETRIASGYNHLLMTTREGGAQAKEYLAKYAADRVRNASSVWLAATIGCAECHDHKFDPYTSKDFYSFASFFADLKEVAVGPQEQVLLPDSNQARRLAELDAEVAAAALVVDTATPELEVAQALWEQSVASQVADWKPLNPTGAVAASGARLAVAKDGSVLAGGEGSATDRYTVVAPVNLPAVTALRIEALPHDSLPGKGPGRATNGNFVLSEVRATIARRADVANARSLALFDASADFQQDGFSAASVIDDKTDTGWAIAPAIDKPHEVVLQVRDSLDAAESVLVIELAQHHGAAHNLGRFRISATASSQPVKANDGLPHEIIMLLTKSPEARSIEERQKLAGHYRSIAPLLEPARKRLATARAAKDDYTKSLPTTLVSMTVAPREMRVLPRGNWLSDAGEVVSPSMPAFLPPLARDETRASRLDLARWLVSPDNPLVARVLVNRLWKLAFGRGIVKTLDDFGAQGAAPSHPELLDWLATELVASGWDIKHMIKLVVMSATYRQSSSAGEVLRQADPDNQWFARQSQYRLDAEMIRDAALATSGLLVTKIGGPSVKPYQPRGYWSHLNFPVREYESDHGEGLYRRGLYTYWCRTFLHPSLSAFDAPSREECAVERPRSNTPLQALVLLNDPTYVETARVFARRVIAEGGSNQEDRLRWAYKQILSRAPEAREVALLGGLLEKHRTQFAADSAAADRLASAGEAPAGADVDRVELAAWTSVVRVLLNLHETITRS
jgi:mono/diheme cytochrome c family protein